ncbi:hypothetical protein ACI2K4_26070 [Micromonospora sp. NPDC050397]|uniref:hypothetical protein n=1 Tax=Micromonospora sp. NPDC050397 TaxID=3364279 RepID=UPI00384AB765
MPTDIDIRNHAAPFTPSPAGRRDLPIRGEPRMSESTINGLEATNQPSPGAAESAEAGVELVPATTAGMPPTAQTFFAVVNSNGTLARGYGAVSSTRLAVGQYQVVFNHDLRGSAYVGTLGLAGSVGGSPSGEIAVVGRNGVNNGVFVQTFSSAGVAADRGFHLAVHS